MIIGVLKVEFYIYENSSLKGKRKILKSLKDKIRHRFNVSISEVEHHDKWQRATVGILHLGQDKRSVNSLLDKVLDFIRGISDIELGVYEIELL